MKRTWIILVVGTIWYLLATLPYLNDFPIIDWAQPMIASPAWKLASEGVYGSEMFRGFYNANLRNYDHMPLFGMFIAASYKLLGFGIWQARVISVLAGLGVIWLTFWLGKILYDDSVGLLAALFLCTLRLSLPNDTDLYNLGYQMNASGIPLLDFARVIRFDVMVPVFVVGACLAFVQARRKGIARRWYFLAGVLTGLAMLTHIYGAFIFPVFLILIIWEDGWVAFRQPSVYWLAAGFSITLTPYLIYILQDLPDYLGQSLRHEARFDLLNPNFYWNSLIHEPWRYLSWLGGSFRHAVLWPRVGLWVVVFGLPVANWMLIHQVREKSEFADRLLLIILPVLMLLLALLINLKRYPYTALILPFLALQLAWVWIILWRRFFRRQGRILLAVVLFATLLEAGIGVLGSFQMEQKGTSHTNLSAALRESIPSGARILGSHAVWFALAKYDFYSVNLAFIRSDPQYGYNPAPSMAEVIDEIAPDYIVMENRLLKKYQEHPESLPGERQEDYLHDLDQYIQLYCPEVVLSFPAKDYGDMVVYRCLP